MKNVRKLHIYSWVIFIVVASVVVLGAYTRLVHAGLGCPDWPTCYGHIWIPNEAHEISKANVNFSETPVETDKTWPEQAHRILASSLGILILGLFLATYLFTAKGVREKSLPIMISVLVVATFARIFVGHALDVLLLGLMAGYFIWILWLYKTASNTLFTTDEHVRHLPQKHAAALAGFVILQGWFGMWTVTLNLWPQVVTTHLLGGFFTTTLIWLFILRTSNWHWRMSHAHILQIKGIQPLAIVTLGVVVLQVALGGWTTSNYAALACADFPTCHGEWLPDAAFIEGFNFMQHVGPNYLGGIMDNAARTAIHLTHRFGAIVVTVIAIILSLKLFAIKTRQTSRLAQLLLLGLVVQIALGVSNIVFGLPLWVAVAHNAGGAALLLVVVTINYMIRSAKAVNH